MKKALKVVLVLSLTLFLALAVNACGEEDDGGDDNGGGGGGGEEELFYGYDCESSDACALIVCGVKAAKEQTDASCAQAPSNTVCSMIEGCLNAFAACVVDAKAQCDASQFAPMTDCANGYTACMVPSI